MRITEAEFRAASERHNHNRATDDDLVLLATVEADHAMRSLPPHCLPTAGGLPENADHANACAHRAWSCLVTLRDRQVPCATCAPGDGVWFGPCADGKNHRPDCPVAVAAKERARLAGER